MCVFAFMYLLRCTFNLFFLHIYTFDILHYIAHILQICYTYAVQDTCFCMLQLAAVAALNFQKVSDAFSQCPMPVPEVLLRYNSLNLSISATKKACFFGR